MTANSNIAIVAATMHATWLHVAATL